MIQRIKRGSVTDHRTLKLYFLGRWMRVAGPARRHVPTLLHVHLLFWTYLAVSVAAATNGAQAEDRPALEPLTDSAYAWIEPYIGQLATIPPDSLYFSEVETCTAVAVAPNWILTAAHCIHVKNPVRAPWTPEYFTGVYPMDSLVFRSAPIGRGSIYKIVDYVKSDRFPDPDATTEDWVFLKLDRPLPIDQDGAPVVGPDRPNPGAADLRITGFIRALTAGGPEDLSASNLLRISRRGCVLRAHRDHLRGAMPGVVNTDCIPPINPGLSGAPMIEFDATGRDRRAVIVALQMGSGRLEGSLEQVPVLVTSDRFVAAYLRIWTQNHAEAPPKP